MVDSPLANTGSLWCSEHSTAESPGNEIDRVGGIRSACIIRVNQISLCWQTKMRQSGWSIDNVSLTPDESPHNEVLIIFWDGLRYHFWLNKSNNYDK